LVLQPALERVLTLRINDMRTAELAEGELVELRAMLDREAIRTVMATYCRGMDRVWPELIASVYDSPSRDHHGTFHGSGHDFALDSEAARLRSTDVNVMNHHLLGQSLIDLDGDGARCETYFWATGVRDCVGEGRTTFFLAGRYLDRFRQVGGDWRLSVRRAVLDLASEVPEPQTWVAAAGYTRGRRWPHDVVFQFDEFVAVDDATLARGSDV
jgi:hypothetical protein